MNPQQIDLAKWASKISSRQSLNKNKTLKKVLVKTLKKVLVTSGISLENRSIWARAVIREKVFSVIYILAGVEKATGMHMLLVRAAARGSLDDRRKASKGAAEIDCCDFIRQTPVQSESSRNLDPVDPLLLFGARTNTGISNWAKDTCVCTSSSKCSCSAPPALTGSTRTLTCYRRHLICQSPRTSNAEIALAANFPAAVAAAMLRGETVKAVSKPAVSILFLHVDGYGNMRGAGMPTTVCIMLARLFGALDALAAAHGVERIDAVDGCYIAAANFSARQPADHAVRIGRFALAAAASITFDA